MIKPDVASDLSIGEVLSLLTDEFPDVTISKIRFLESQGLINPERTPSGYRKFYEADIDRLRWVLRQQRDHFLPLKVIKSKLEDGVDLTLDDQPPLFGDERDTHENDEVATNPGSDPASPNGSVEQPVSGSDDPGAPVGRPGNHVGGDPGVWLAALQESPPGLEPTAAAIAPIVARAKSDLVTLGELARMADVSPELIDDLAEYGVVVPTDVGGEPMYDEASADVVRAAREFFDQGVSARHLRIFKNAADREASFLEQLVLPLLKQRNPKARAAAVARLEVLANAGVSLHRALVAQSLRGHLGG